MRVEARYLLDGFEGLGEVDIVPAFTDPYPRLTFFAMRWRPGRGDARGPRLCLRHQGTQELRGGRPSVGHFTAYMTMMCDRRETEKPRGDLLDGVLTARIEGRPITRDEAVRSLMQLTFGGLAATSAALANIIRRLAEQPDLQQRLRTDRAQLLPQPSRSSSVSTPSPS